MLNLKLVTRGLLSLLLATLLTACSSIPNNNIHINSGNLTTTSESHIAQQLYQQYQEWHGTPYAWGGMSKRGVDCSGFVYVTLREQFGTQIPRTTAQQVQTGNYISDSELAAGDLVFFKTGSKARHVGIYVEDGKFLHASTSHGVIISRLDNVYWKKHYWHARRIR